MVERDCLQVDDHVLRRALLGILAVLGNDRAVLVVGVGFGSGLENDSDHGV